MKRYNPMNIVCIMLLAIFGAVIGFFCYLYDIPKRIRGLHEDNTEIKPNIRDVVHNHETFIKEVPAVILAEFMNDIEFIYDWLGELEYEHTTYNIETDEPMYLQFKCLENGKEYRLFWEGDGSIGMLLL